jgi:flagellar basal-body rod protein FlgG
MNNAFKTGTSGLKAHQTRIDNIANNIANVQTTGFKKTDVEFEDLLYTQFDANDLSKVQGHGVKVQGTPIDFTSGSLMQSDQALDIAIVGDAFFALLDQNGVSYTRNGSFRISEENNIPYLVNVNGQYVLDNKLNRIVIPQKEDNSINQDLLLNTIGTFSFANNSGLIKADNTSFLATEGSGAITALNSGDVELRPYTLEQANVDLGKSMVELLEGQRAFQLNARVVQTADQIEDIVNNLR